MSDILQQAARTFDGVPLSVQFIAGALVLAIAYAVLTGDRPLAGVPIVTIQRKGWERLLPSKFAFLTHGKEILAKGLAEHKSPFQINTGSGYKIVLQNKFAEEIKSNPHANFNEAFKADLFIDYPGMDGNREGLRDDSFMQELVRIKLTQSLGLVTDDLVEETDDALRTIFGESDEWTAQPIKDNLLDLVARLSARVFLGRELCRNARWLQISKDYTIDSFIAARLLRMCPDLLRPVLYWFIPNCTRLRQQVRDARNLINPEVQLRIKRREEAIANGEKGTKASDAIAWMVDISKTKGRDTDYVAAQLALTSAAIHTTSETMLKCLVRLGKSPEVAEQLRAEVIQVLTTEGWSKMSLYKLKLMDSFLKEVQRSSAMSMTSMNRMIKKPITLSDGTTLPAGARIMVSDEKPMDPEVFPEPEKFDAARFLNMRERPGEENRHQFVTTSDTIMAFGHGAHACPGRFFAGNEIKISLCFMLLRYDLRFPPGEEKPTEMFFETNSVSLPVEMQVRRRREEINLLSPRATN